MNHVLDSAGDGCIAQVDWYSGVWVPIKVGVGVSSGEGGNRDSTLFQ